MTNPLVRLGQLGQSPWYDFITRDLVQDGELARLIREDGLRGMTSNPTIFEKAIATSARYDDDIRRLAAAGTPAAAIFEALAVADVRQACDLFRPVFEAEGNGDGTVSLEVSPTLAHDTEGTVREAARLWAAVDRPNLMVKIPGTKAGLPAVTRCLAQGISVNVTLLFSVERYAEVVEAHVAGLEQFFAHGGTRAPMSVASFFVSRVDSKVDPLLDQKAGRGDALRGTIAIANAAMAYLHFQATLATPRWTALAAKGATPQRTLWASTGTKDPRYADVLYVEALIGPGTVNTLPPATYDAYRDHGEPQLRLPDHAKAAASRLQALPVLGIDLAQITRDLEEDGVKQFTASFESLLQRIEAKAGLLAER